MGSGGQCHECKQYHCECPRIVSPIIDTKPYCPHCGAVYDSKAAAMANELKAFCGECQKTFLITRIVKYRASEVRDAKS